MDEPKKDVIRETDAEAIRLAKTLLRSARFGALAVIEPQTGSPLASRVGVATDIDGAPLILVSMLSAHTGALL
ncbi:HugZ family protein, partial [Mesorhizobium sp. M7A.F.Ca.CA.001.10.2.1]